MSIKKSILLGPCLLLLSLSAGADEAEKHRYEVEIKGPAGKVTFSCNDPCEFDALRQVGRVDGELTLTSKAASQHELRMDLALNGVHCSGTCAGADADMLIFKQARALREGLQVTIRDNYAYFTFHTVVPGEHGEASKVEYSEFRIDRPLILLDLHDHDVSVRTAMDASERARAFFEVMR